MHLSRTFCSLLGPALLRTSNNQHRSCVVVSLLPRVSTLANRASGCFPLRLTCRTFATDERRGITEPPAERIVPNPPNTASTSITSTLSSIKKRAPKKNADLTADANAGSYNVVAYATAEEYDLERLRASLIKENLYQFHDLPQPEAIDAATSSSAASSSSSLRSPLPDSNATDFLYVSARIQLTDEPREIFFFRTGSVVLWNCSDLEGSNVLAQLKHCEVDGYDRRLVEAERDCMAYGYEANRHRAARLANGQFVVSRGANAALEKYTFANAMSASVKLGIWEAALDRYVDSMAYVTADLKRGAKIRMSRAEVLRRTGELFALRHLINLSSDLLDTPDFYWDREQLEGLYSSACGYFSVQRRTKVRNDTEGSKICI